YNVHHIYFFIFFFHSLHSDFCTFLFLYYMTLTRDRLSFPTRRSSDLAEELIRLLHSEGKDVQLFTVGSKAKNYYTFRDRKIERSWTGISENPVAENAREIGEALLENFDPESEDSGVDEIYIVFTRFVSSVTHDPEYRRLLPLEVVDADEASTGGGSAEASSAAAFPLYEFEPSAEAVLDALLPRYIDSRILS